MSLIEEVLAWLASQPGEIYLVGGYVRDRLLGRTVRDLDLAVPAGGRTLARELANRFHGGYYPLDQERDTGRALLPWRPDAPLIIDVARLRGPTLRADLLDRDFTINAMASPAHDLQQIVDPTRGQADLGAAVLRAVSHVALERDPVRSLRAVRQAAELGFSIEAHTESLVRQAAPLLWRVSGERLRDELVHLLELPGTGPLVRRLDHLGLLTHLLPELEPCRGLHQTLPHVLDVLEHTLTTLDALDGILSAVNEIHASLGPYIQERRVAARSRSIMIKLAGLLHDVGKPACRTTDEAGRVHFFGHAQRGAKTAKTVLERFRFSTAEVTLAATMVTHHMRPLHLAAQESVSARAVYRFFRDTRDAGPATLLLALADQAATYAAKAPASEEARLHALAVRMLGDYFERHQTRVSPPPLLSGYDLLDEFKLEPGPCIGRLLELLREAQAAGEVRTRDEALDLVRERLKDA